MSAAKSSASANSCGPQSPDCQEARRWDEMHAGHRDHAKARRRNCDRARVSWLAVSSLAPGMPHWWCLLTREVLQNMPACQDAELNSALRNNRIEAV